MQVGIARHNLIVTNSNGDINLELSQLRAEVAQGCDVIFSFPGSATGLCAGVREAFEKGVLFVTIDSPAECPEAINFAPDRLNQSDHAVVVELRSRAYAS